MGVHVIAPIAALQADPLPGAVAVVPLTQAVAGVTLPEGAARMAVEIDGTETAEQIAALKSLDAVVVLLNIQDGMSRVHASRRVFDVIKQNEITVPVVHHIRFAPGASRDEIVINTGSWVGGLLVDGMGDGALIEAPHEELDFLRTTSFGLLQVRREGRWFGCRGLLWESRSGRLAGE